MNYTINFFLKEKKINNIGSIRNRRPQHIHFGLGSVESRFVADRNSVGFARKTALTILFVERGFERLGLDR